MDASSRTPLLRENLTKDAIRLPADWNASTFVGFLSQDRILAGAPSPIRRAGTRTLNVQFSSISLEHCAIACLSADRSVAPFGLFFKKTVLLCSSIVIQHSVIQSFSHSIISFLGIMSLFLMSNHQPITRLKSYLAIITWLLKIYSSPINWTLFMHFCRSNYPMRLLNTLVLLSFLASFSYGQHRHCGTDEYEQEQMSKDPNYTPYYLPETVQTAIDKRNSSHAKAEDIIYIPVVFHVIHEYGPENISDCDSPVTKL